MVQTLLSGDPKSKFAAKGYRDQFAPHVLPGHFECTASSIVDEPSRWKSVHFDRMCGRRASTTTILMQ